MIVYPFDAKHPFELRDGTSDAAMYAQVFVEKSMDLSGLKRWPDILAHYGKLEAPLIIDAGANIGCATAWFSHQYRRAHILALEPEESNFQQLCTNHAACYAPDNVTPSRLGLCAVPGIRLIVDPGSTHAAATTRVAVTETRDTVASVTVNRMYATWYDKQPFLVKIDIEGAEVDVLATNLDWINQTPIIMIEIHDWLYPGRCSGQSVINALANRDRDLIIHGEHLVSIDNRI